MRPGWTRRAFLGACLAVAGAAKAYRGAGPAPREPLQVRTGPPVSPLALPIPERELHGDSSLAAALRAGEFRELLRPPAGAPLPALDLEAAGRALAARFRDLKRHFVFEYYAWYAADPWFHWNEAGRRPPLDLASNYMPRLGAYDSRDRRVLEQHARWIADTGAGAIDVSWWGPDSFSDRAVPLVMDVMRDHDIHVTFHLEPYRDDRAAFYAQDLLYLIRRYGDRRGWDCFLLLERADGTAGPVFKSFRTILPPFTVDCHGLRFPVPDYAPDDVWLQQTRQVRELFKRDFDHVTLLADSLDVGRTAAAGFDGIAIYDNFVLPSTWPPYARACSARDLLFSFNTNPGYDAVAPRPPDPPPPPDPNACPPGPLQPPGDEVDWTTAAGRRLGARISRRRIHETFATTLALQLDPALTNARRGFFLVYLNSFNEWLEGHQFEPTKDYDELTPAERAVGYHNAQDGDYRRRELAALLRRVISPVPAAV